MDNEPKIDLPNVTLVCIDTLQPIAAKRVLDHCNKFISPAQTILFTSGVNYTDITTIQTPEIKKIEDYSWFVLKNLHTFIPTEHVLIVQTDGFIINPNKWKDEFLDYDYIGAPWVVGQYCAPFPPATKNNLVGNGGFSLRSKRLLQDTADSLKDRNTHYHPEDCYIVMPGEFVKRGFKFAPIELASEFSGENNKITTQFGFHGKLTIAINPHLKNYIYDNLGIKFI